MAGGAGRAAGASAETGPDQHRRQRPRRRARHARWPSETGGAAAGSNRELAETADVVVLATKPGALGAVAEEMRVTVADRGLPVVSILGATADRRRSSRPSGPGTAGAALHAQRRRRGPRRDLLLRAGRRARRAHRAQPARPLRPAGRAGAGRGAADGRRDGDLGLRPGLLRAGRREPRRRRREGGPRRAPGRAARDDDDGGHRRAAAQARRRRGRRCGARSTSPGGVTAAGLAALEEYGVRAAFGAAVEAVVEKAEAAQPRRGESA